MGVLEDPCFVVGQAALAVALAELDAPDVDEWARSLALARSCSRRVSRFERHHAEVIALALDGAAQRSAMLAMEHLAEYPDDGLVRYVLECGRGGQPGSREGPP